MYYQIIRLHRFVESFYNVEDPLRRIHVFNKIENIHLKNPTLIKRINESKTIVKHTSNEFRLIMIYNQVLYEA